MAEFYTDALGPNQRMSPSGRFVLFTLHNVAIELTPDAQVDDFPITAGVDSIFDAHLLEDGFWPAIDRGTLSETDIVASELKLDVSTARFEAGLNLIILNERAAQYEGTHKPLGFLDFNTEAKPYSNGADFSIFFFENGLMQVEVTRALRETEGLDIYDKAESLIRLFKYDKFTERPAFGGDTIRGIKGIGFIDDFVQLWPEMYDLAKNLP